MSPGAGIVGPAVFFPGAPYELRISNDGDPLTDEIIVTTVFSQPDASGRQTFMITAQTGAGQSQSLAQGVTNGRPVNIRGGGRATAGIFDDPFFFDVTATSRFNREATFLFLNRTTGFPLPSDITPTTNPVRHFLRPNFPNNFFGGFNTLAIIIEVPRTRIQSGRNNPNISAWIRSVADIGDGRGFAQFDRTALPSINTVVTPLTRTINREILPGGLQDQFNFLIPRDDPALRPIAITRIVNIFGNTQTRATELANLFLPDVANFNTTSRDGFPNGRRLPDDVIDIELGLLTNNALTTDRVNNDSFFRRTFPYIGAPNPVTTVLRSLQRNALHAEQGQGTDQD